MGILTIETTGSFNEKYETFSALQGGHADAVARAIEYLSGQVLPEAVQSDHKLHDEGERPPEKDFGLGKS